MISQALWWFVKTRYAISIYQTSVGRNGALRRPGRVKRGATTDPNLRVGVYSFRPLRAGHPNAMALPCLNYLSSLLSHGKALKRWRVSFEGIVFLLLSIALVIGGVLILSRANEYQAMARIKVHRDVDSSPAGERQKPYDPYFIQTEFEVLQSEAVLRKVAESINPVRISQKELAGDEQSRLLGIINAIRRRMDLRVVRNTELIEIRMTNTDPVEAARLANAIA